MTCIVDGCEYKIQTAELCSTHYKQKLAGKLVLEYIPASPATFDEILAVMKNQGRTPPEYCGVANCARPHRAANVCQQHYMRVYNYYIRKGWEWPDFRSQFVPDVDVFEYVQPAKGFYLSPKNRKCHVPGCMQRYMGRGLCVKHYSRWHKLSKAGN